MIKIMILGATSQLGKELHKKAKSLETFDIVTYNTQLLDITNFNALSTIIENETPHCIINTEEFSDIDSAESNSKEAFSVNETGAKNIATTCNTHNIPLIHLSTSHVFDGQKDSPYNEKDIPNPQNIYGQSKYQGEQAIRNIAPKHIILRTSWIFSLHKNNFIESILQSAQERDELHIVADQLGCPTSASSVAHVILQIVAKICSGKFKEKKFGTYHYNDAPETTWFGFASAIVEAAAAVEMKPSANKIEKLKIKHIIPIMTHEDPTKAKRPINSRLNISRTEKIFKIQRTEWRPELDKLIDKLYE